LRDLNGDGMADHISRDSSGNWTVAMGTGAGFAPPKAIVAPFRFALSSEVVGCFSDKPTAGTIVGLFDFKGDGVPELLQKTTGGFQVYQLDAVHQPDGTNVPAASGLLAQIDNGYGGTTTILYGSAKEDASTNHLLPHAEIVVRSITVAATQGQTTQLTSKYAYGGASQFFDAAADRWVFPGYQRRVALQNTINPDDPGDQGAGNAVITDAYPLAGFDPGMDTAQRLTRYLKAGRTRDVTTLSGDTGHAFDVGTDPAALLTADITSDARRIASRHMDYTLRRLPDGLPDGPAPVVDPNDARYCVDMVSPYDYDQSLGYAKDSTAKSADQCAERGFVLQTSVTSYRGTPATTDVGTADVITSPSTVKSSSLVTAFDDFGRVTDSVSNGDLADPSTSLCMHVDYATPNPDLLPVHVLNAPAQQMLQTCNGANSFTLAKTRLEYFQLAAGAPDRAGQVSDGSVASSTVTRYDLDPLNQTPPAAPVPRADIRLFDKTYNADGTLHQTKRIRDDGAVDKDQFGYDGFGLVVISAISTGFDPIGGTAPAIPTSSLFHPVTLDVTSATDANGTARSTTYDGFRRVTSSAITKPDRTGGFLSSTTYAGFELNSTAGRSISQTVFTNAVPDVNAPGRTSITFLDSLGRVTETDVLLGDNYQETLSVQSFYDGFGRLTFKTDPFRLTPGNNFQQDYGTTYIYNTDGTPKCTVRGKGVQSASSVDETNFIYPTCFSRSFANNQEIQTRSDADALLSGSPQSGVSKQTILNALGRALESRTLGSDGSPLEDMVFSYDPLGHRSGMTRYGDPANKANPVSAFWHYDSLGRVTMLHEDGVADRTRTYDFWGNLTIEQWCNDGSSFPCQASDRRSITRYDGRNRVIHKEDQTNNSGQPVSGTAMDYSYDNNGGVIAGVPRNNVLGRPASATWSTGQVWFTYDAFGRVNSRSFVDTSVTPNAHHYEIHEFNDDGSEKTLQLQLQDTNKDNETVTYDYDTAGRMKSAVYSFGGSAQTLFAASGTNPIYDELGRIINAQYGPATYHATYAAAARRLLQNVTVTSTSGDGVHSREIVFPGGFNGLVSSYDPMNRERQRREFVDGTPGPVLMRSYDALGQLAATQSLQVTTNTVLPDRAFTYDPLGNIVNQTDSSTPPLGSVALVYDATDLDRVIAIAYSGSPLPIQCCLAYDGAGNITNMPGRDGTPRSFSYFPSGHVSGIVSGGSNASFIYDPFGAVQQLTVTGPAEIRNDKHFGAFIKQRTEGPAAVLTRNIPAGGVTAIKHGPAGSWTFAFSETTRGTRYAVDQTTGAFVQNVDYQPYGEVKNPSGATPGTTNYVSEQFNGGDFLQAFGVVELGARLYDPVIGRFLSRDPLLVPRSASKTNPYAFAHNDPINKVDPTGMDPVQNVSSTSSNPRNPNEHDDPGYTSMCAGAEGCPQTAADKDNIYSGVNVPLALRPPSVSFDSFEQAQASALTNEINTLFVAMLHDRTPVAQFNDALAKAVKGVPAAIVARALKGIGDPADYRFVSDGLPPASRLAAEMYIRLHLGRGSSTGEQVKRLLIGQNTSTGGYFSSPDAHFPDVTPEAIKLLSNADRKLALQYVGELKSAEPIANRIATQVADPNLPLDVRVRNYGKIIQDPRISKQQRSDAYLELSPYESDNYLDVVKQYSKR
jgi:RHS repeat-associated protein